MKFICLGYIDQTQWESLPDAERNTMMDECFAYDDVLRKGGHFAGGEALHNANRAVTLQWRNGQAAVTEGPFAETKEQLGGILILEARDMQQAIELMSQHPGIKAGPFEVRPAADLSEMIRASEIRRQSASLAQS